jgi:tetratricopeptide (TPR) repeat protein
MKGLLIILILIVSAHATSQIPDKLKYNKHTYLINPIKTNYKTNERYSTACYRGYVATWEIKNDSLFLKSVKTRKCSKKSKNEVIEKILGKGRLASWYSGSILISNFKKIDSFDKIKIYEHLAVDVKNGVCVRTFPTYVYDDSNYLYGIYYLKNGFYLKALANFTYLLIHYPDFFKNDWNYLFISCCLQYLGHDSLSNEYLDSLLIKCPKSKTIELAHAVRYFLSADEKTKNEELAAITDTSILKVITNREVLLTVNLHESTNEFKSYLVFLFPWIFTPVSKYDDSLESFFDGTIDIKPLKNPAYEIVFKDKAINMFFNELKKMDPTIKL